MAINGKQNKPNREEMRKMDYSQHMHCEELDSYELDALLKDEEKRLDGEFELMGPIDIISAIFGVEAKKDRKPEPAAPKPKQQRESMNKEMPDWKNGIKVRVPYAGEVILDYSPESVRGRNRLFSGLNQVGWDNAVDITDALEKHPVLNLDLENNHLRRDFRKTFIRPISRADVPSKHRFYSALPLATTNVYRFEGGYFEVSLQFVLRNDGAEAYNRDILKHWFERALMVQSPRCLRSMAGEIPAYLMSKSAYPFSALGTFRRVELADKGAGIESTGIERITETPLIAVPGTEPSTANEWSAGLMKVKNAYKRY